MPPLTPQAQFLHPVPKPITFLEFFNAVRATTPPRFPHARVSQPRRIALAVSGGVDSMALAFLFNQLREINPLMKIADNPLARITAYVIDHGLRQESAEEAFAVSKELRKFKYIVPIVDKINWKKEGIEGDPALSPNLESIARRARYRRLGLISRNLNVESIFLAHHQDDQYETVLMRLLAGHGSRGLRGMMPHGSIPECYDMHGVYESGHVDDQALRMPMVSFRPPKRDWKYVRRELSADMDWELYSAELRAGLQMGWHEGPYVDDEVDSLFAATASATAKAKLAAAAAAARSVQRIVTEDAGVMIYRPLLEFSKDRLIATCEKNNVPWFEDRTNADRTLTMRNAVRHMVRNHQLPEALRKESVLRMSARCDARVKAEEWEAERWIRRGVKAEFEPNVGTLIVTLPSMATTHGKTRHRSGKKRRELRLAQKRTIAAIVVRKLLSFVSPEKHHAQLSSLQTVVARLFPSLSDPSDPPVVPRKPFNQASVLFLPLSDPNKWYLVREPYPSIHPVPETTFNTNASGFQRRHPQFPPARPDTELKDGQSLTDDPTKQISSMEWLHRLQHEPLRNFPEPSSRNWYSWKRFQLWDGRFWIRLRGRARSVFRIAPFSPQHAKAFREGLGGGSSSGSNSSNKEVPADDARIRFEGILKRFAPGKVRYTLPALYAVNRDEETGQEILRMLALPTLGIQLPGLERWVLCEARYRKVDWDLLDLNPHRHEVMFNGSIPMHNRRWKRFEWS
ncbi:PP-loop family protein [Colletotrichum truncatum]|uniref:PP-loop family protein n=1 Tax=Colletotrichum truncatum TaxID=5467 RepID=A0ACC3Z940_COLTU|nr:PP-loop family protein [Colletotrichum truncatum]KAF6793488.1 PP-loop family protein [Colletotrichum truncatum]